MIPIARPRIVTDGKRAWYIVRDEEHGSKVSVYYNDDMRHLACDSAVLVGSEWKLYDLTDFPVNAWEPSYDTELWKKQRKLHLFVQDTRQGDGERTVAVEPQTVYVMEVK